MRGSADKDGCALPQSSLLASIASYDRRQSPQPKYLAFPNAYAPPCGAAFAFSTPVEALWKQEGEKSFVIKRIAGATEIISIQTTTCTCAAFIAAIAAWISA